MTTTTTVSGAMTVQDIAAVVAVSAAFVVAVLGSVVGVALTM